MNHPDEERITELAMKTAARQITPAELAELDALRASDPVARREFEQRLVDARGMADAASLLNATENRRGEMPGYARERLRTKVLETYASPAVNSTKANQWTWRLVLSWAGGLAVMVAVIISMLLRPQEPVLHLAMLDPIGAARGDETNLLAVLQGGWPKVKASTFKTADEVTAWKSGRAAAGTKDIVFVIYDRSAGELEVSGTKHGRKFARRFEVGQNLSPVLEEVRRFIKEQ